MKPSFEENKLRRLIKTHGTQFNFTRKEKNQFGEVDETALLTVNKIYGVYHEQNSYVSVSHATGTRSQSKPIPMVLTLWKEVVANPVKIDDLVCHNNLNYRVSGITNIQEGNYGADISLELVI